MTYLIISILVLMITNALTYHFSRKAGERLGGRIGFQKGGEYSSELIFKSLIRLQGEKDGMNMYQSLLDEATIILQEEADKQENN